MKTFLSTLILMFIFCTTYGQVSPVQNDPVPVSPSEPVFTVVEQMPVYEGGEAALMKLVQTNLNYPADAREMQIQGRVVVGFIIDSTGAMDSIIIKKKLWPSLDREALRVVHLMQGHWTAGTQQGKAVSVRFMLPLMMRIGSDYIPVYNPAMTIDEANTLVAFDKGKYGIALKFYRDLCGKQPDNNFAAHNLGLCLYMTGDKGAAYDIWTKLRDKDWHTADHMLYKAGIK